MHMPPSEADATSNTTGFWNATFANSWYFLQGQNCINAGAAHRFYSLGYIYDGGYKFDYAKIQEQDLRHFTFGFWSSH